MALALAHRRETLDMNPPKARRVRQTDAIRAALVAPLLSLASAGGAAQAGVIQQVNAEFTTGILGTPPTASDSDEVFALTSAGITTNIFANVGGTGPGHPGYVSTSSAGIFGQVGLRSGVFGVGPGSSTFAEVLVGSDEFVNAFGGPARVRASFIVDGGSIQDFFSTDTTVTFTLQVGAENLGPVGPETRPAFMESDARDAALFGSFGGFFPGFEGGGYTATLATGAAGAWTFTTEVMGGLDLAATFDSSTGVGVVDIPFSLQTLDLGVLLPGDRLVLGYVASFSIVQGGVAEGVFAEFSDPFALSASSILAGVTLTPLAPVPAPGTLVLIAAALPIVLGFRSSAPAWRCRGRSSRAAPR